MTEPESVESFRRRARAWLHDNVPRRTGRKVVLRAGASDEDELAEVQRERTLQRQLFDGGFAGICFPQEYGGLGLTREHQRAFNQESVGSTMPDIIQIPTMTPCAAVLLEFGTEEQKLRHVRRCSGVRRSGCNSSRSRVVVLMSRRR